MYKLRGQRKDNGEWLYSRSIDDRGPDGVFMRSGKDWVEVEGGTVGRYIANCNNGSEEVYDGDLLQFILSVNNNKSHIYYDDDDCSCMRAVWNKKLTPMHLDIETLNRMKKVGTVFDVEDGK